MIFLDGVHTATDPEDPAYVAAFQARETNEVRRTLIKPREVPPAPPQQKLQFY